MEKIESSLNQKYKQIYIILLSLSVGTFIGLMTVISVDIAINGSFLFKGKTREIEDMLNRVSTICAEKCKDDGISSFKYSRVEASCECFGNVNYE